jgi:hypothetical protein
MEWWRSSSSWWDVVWPVELTQDNGEMQCGLEHITNVFTI